MSSEEFRNGPVECWPCVSSTIRWHTSHVYFFCGSCPIKALSPSADVWKTIHLHFTVTADFPPSLATPHLLPRPGPQSRTGVSVAYSNRQPQYRIAALPALSVSCCLHRGGRWKRHNYQAHPRGRVTHRTPSPLFWHLWQRVWPLTFQL